MTKLTADEVLTQQHKRAYLQWGGPSPTHPVTFAGQDGQYMTITGVSGVADAGGFDAKWAPDPSNPKRYRLIGMSASVPELPAATVTFFEKHGILPKQLFKSCLFSAYEVSGACPDLSDMYNGVSDYMLVYSQARVGAKNLGDRVTMDTDDLIADELSVVLADVYPVGPLGFGDNALTMIDKEVIDVVYGTKTVCGNCGVENDGSGWIYAVTKSSGAGSPGLPAEVIYSVDGGLTWNQTNITGIGASEDPVAIDIVGSRLVVLTPTAGGATNGGYYWADIDPDTGIPGTWNKVTSGFSNTHEPRDMFVLSPREVFFCGDDGYIYKSTDITAGVTVNNDGKATTQNLARITGIDPDILVAVGAAGTVIKSNNRGATWATTSASPTITALQAVAVKSAKTIFVGTANGYMWFTENGGKSWAISAFSGQGAGQVYDIVFASEEIGYALHSTGTPTARILYTLDGGRNWTPDCWRKLNWPVFNDAKRIHAPTSTDTAVNVNNVAVAGVTSTGDGILLLGIAAKQ